MVLLAGKLLGPEADFWPSHERMWAELPEWPFDRAQRKFIGDGTQLPARTLMHGSPNGIRFHQAFGRGDDWVDPDANLFHFVGGIPQDRSMTVYDRFFLDDLMDDYLALHSDELDSRNDVPSKRPKP